MFLKHHNMFKIPMQQYRMMGYANKITNPTLHVGEGNSKRIFRSFDFVTL